MTQYDLQNADWTSPGLWAQSITNGRWLAYDHLVPLDLALTVAANTPNSRVIVMMPPRSGKSTLASLYFPSWYRCRWPRRNIGFWSATARLAQRFSRHTRQTSKEILEPMGIHLDESTKSWETWKIAGSKPAEGEFYAAGVGSGTTMGVGVHLGIIDDYHRNVQDALSQNIRENQKDWYLSCVQTRLEPGASLVIVATRWHRDDLIGFVQQEAIQTGEKWQVVNMPAISPEGKALWPERYPIEKLNAIKRRFEVNGRPWMWEALYQQEPPEVLDSEWDPSYFHDGIYFDDWPAHPVLRLVALDPSLGKTDKADFSAFVDLAVTADGHFWIAADLARRDAVAQARAAALHVKHFQASAFAVEANAFQSIMAVLYEQEAHKLGVMAPVWPVFSDKEKATRIRAFISPHLAAGRLHFKRNMPGVNLLLEQLRGFPSHKFDDGPDALAMGIQVANSIRSGSKAVDEVALA